MSNNKIEYPSKKTYWIAKDGKDYVTHGSTETNQTTESKHTLATYSTEKKWKSALNKYGIETEDI